MFESCITKLGGLIHILNIGIWFQPIFGSDRQWTNTSELIVSASLVLYLLIFYISIIIIPEKLKAKMSKEHPEYNFA